MSRLIDADELINAIADFPYGYRGMIKNVIAEQPTVEERKGKWIPCSERLPKESGKYLVTLKGGAVETDSFCKVDNKWVYFNTQIAWFSRELPEPYKGE